MGIIEATSGALQRPLRQALDLLLPPRCLGCGILVEDQGALCPTCWSAITFVSDPLCSCCGLPFAYGAGEEVPALAELLCGACLAEPPAFTRARTVMRYDDASRALLLAFKHGDRVEGAATFAAWMARAGASLLADCDIIAPVPLHWRRLFTRRYNQSALLAAALARHNTDSLARHGEDSLARNRRVLLVPDLLQRRRATPSQGRLSRAERQRNVAGAFAVHPARRAALAGRRLLLIDDVMTTGATVGACARAALRAGAAAVDVLVLARALRD